MNRTASCAPYGTYDGAFVAYSISEIIISFDRLFQNTYQVQSIVPGVKEERAENQVPTVKKNELLCGMLRWLVL